MLKLTLEFLCILNILEFKKIKLLYYRKLRLQCRVAIGLVWFWLLAA